MAYSPYKMKGHTLPGIKQKENNEYGELSKSKRSPAKCPLIAALPAITGAISAVGAMKKKKEE